MKGLEKGIIIFLIVVLSVNHSFAQDSTMQKSKIPFSIGFYHHEGFFYKHRPSIYGLPDALAQGIEVNIRRITFGKKHWEQLYKYPNYGLTFIYMNNGIPLLGHSFMLIPYFGVPIFRSKRHSMYFDIGIGGSYVSKTYSDDTLNKLISNHVNYAALVRLSYNFQITSTLKLDISANFLHNSNGGANRPNLGINTPSLSLGIQYLFNQENLTYRKDSIPKVIRRPIFSLSYGLGYKAVEDSKMRTFNTYFCHVVSFSAGYQLTRRSIPTIGIDWLYDLSLEGRLGDLEQSQERKDYYHSLSPLVRNTRLGMLLGHELVVTNKLTMIGQFGFFVFNPFKVDADSKGFGIYQRLGLRYLVNKNIFVAWYLKTFYARADNWELTLGYRF